MLIAIERDLWDPVYTFVRKRGMLRLKFPVRTSTVARFFVKRVMVVSLARR